MFAITNEERTQFLTARNGVLNWTANINLAYTFESEAEAYIYTESVSDFLNYESDVLAYVNNISDLYTKLF